jgi:hypothetical protein
MSNQNIYNTFSDFLQTYKNYFKSNVQETEFNKIQIGIVSKSKITLNYKK